MWVTRTTVDTNQELTRTLGHDIGAGGLEGRRLGAVDGTKVRSH